MRALTDRQTNAHGWDRFNNLLSPNFFQQGPSTVQPSSVAAPPRATWLLSFWRHSVTSCCHPMASSDVMTSCYDVTWRHGVTWCCTIGQGLVSVRSNETKPGNYDFQPGDLDLWPMTFTIKLIQDTTKVNRCTKFRDHTSNSSAVRALTDRQTHTRTGPFL